MPLITKHGPNGPVSLAARVWDLLADAYKEAGLDPADVVVTQGSPSHGSLSGSTHDGKGGGVFDLRLWNLPESKHEALVVALRRRNVCAWKRDKRHGGFDPHLHGVVRDQPGLSRGARWQVAEYDLGHNGLDDRAPDYHPRPVQRHWPFPPAKPTKGATKVSYPRGTYARRSPSLTAAKVGPLRKPGYVISYVSVVKTAEGTWLKTRFGNYYLARRTERGT